jgi:hypothetical protein
MTPHQVVIHLVTAFALIALSVMLFGQVRAAECETVKLASQTADLPAGSCALICDFSSDLVAIETEDTGLAAAKDSQDWFEVERIDGRWLLVLEQEFSQCWLGEAAQ